MRMHKMANPFGSLSRLRVRCMLQNSALTLRLPAQAANFFKAYHVSVAEALLSMLRKEQWQRLSPGSEGARTAWQHACAQFVHNAVAM